jgi:5-dehydro-2-deoxygluconokinase
MSYLQAVDTPDLDLVTIGRVSVDLYGQQLASRLEDVASFAKAVGGCPANVAIGAARLGLKSALISRVGASYRNSSRARASPRAGCVSIRSA